MSREHGCPRLHRTARGAGAARPADATEPRLQQTRGRASVSKPPKTDPSMATPPAHVASPSYANLEQHSQVILWKLSKSETHNLPSNYILCSLIIL